MKYFDFKKRTILSLAVLALLTTVVNPAGAVQITYYDNGVAYSGSLGGVSFMEVPISLSLEADTAGITHIPVGPLSTYTYINEGWDAVVKVHEGTYPPLASPAMTATFTDHMAAVVDQLGDLAGIVDADTGVLVLGTKNIPFASYALGVLYSVEGNAESTLGGTFPTSLGPLTHLEMETYTDFAATVPEPSTLLLLGSGLVGLGVWGPKKFKCI